MENKTKNSHLGTGQIQKILDETNLNVKMDQVEELLKNNEIEFPFKGDMYRVQKPTFGQKKETYKRRNKVMIDMYNDGTYMLQKDLIKMLKDKRGIDIEEMDRKYFLLVQQKEQKQGELGKLMEEKADKKQLEVFNDEITKIEREMNILSLEKAHLLEFSIEHQAETEIYLYLAYLLTEKKIEESGKEVQWVKVWNSYDDFLNSYEELIDVASYYATIVSQNEIR